MQRTESVADSEQTVAFIQENQMGVSRFRLLYLRPAVPLLMN